MHMMGLLESSNQIARKYNKTHGSVLNSIRNLLKRNPELKDDFIEGTYKDGSGRSRPCFYLTIAGEQIMKNKFELNTVARSLETPFVDELSQALKAFNIYGERQYKVLNYRIDFYIPKLKVAIEYDENDHKNYSYEEQELRELHIKKELGCRFIRVSDKNTNAFNIALVLKELIYNGWNQNG